MQGNVLQKFNILLVDDERLIRDLVHGVLSSLGFTNITAVNSGRQAIDKLSKNKFDFVITDWRMDDLDGIDVVNYVRRAQQQPANKIPIIMLTGNTEAHYVKTAINAGVNSYILKPFSAQQLLKRIRTIIESPRDFVILETFTGPDRRHAAATAPNGVERRKARKRK